jgi:hypothetical protein
MFPALAEAVDFATRYRELAAPIIANIRCRLKPAQRPLLVAVCGRVRAGKNGAALRSLSEAGIASLHARLDEDVAGIRSTIMQCPVHSLTDVNQGLGRRRSTPVNYSGQSAQSAVESFRLCRDRRILTIYKNPPCRIGSRC